MPRPSLGLADESDQSEWMRLHTLILLRWVAITGQLAAIFAAGSYFDLELPLGLCLLVVGASVIVNLVLVFIYPETKRLTEPEALALLGFDLTQLGVLLVVTGGLTNPFALLILVPVTISASTLTLRSTIILGIVAISLATLNAFVSIPLRFASGSTFAVPPLFGFGFWLSILIGIVFLALYSRRVATEIRSMSDALLAAQMALAREQKLTDLGGVVAAAAHELGTPLATIKMVSAELMDELTDRPDLQEDARLIRDQADRCRDILRSMGRAGKDDLHLRNAPLETVLREAAEPHLARGKTVLFDLGETGAAARQPEILRRPEIIHGLRNLIQNAVDFARTTVWIEAQWDSDRISLRIMDDGPGYPPQLIGRIGDPFVRNRRGADSGVDRPGYEGMGLGLFIAKTLLERTGAELVFANGADPFLAEHERPERCGAIVAVTWARDRLAAPARDQALGQNTPFA
jgi:two-component system sensor histidine kinase RegB